MVVDLCDSSHLTSLLDDLDRMDPRDAVVVEVVACHNNPAGVVDMEHYSWQSLYLGLCHRKAYLRPVGEVVVVIVAWVALTVASIRCLYDNYHWCSLECLMAAKLPDPGGVMEALDSAASEVVVVAVAWVVAVEVLEVVAARKIDDDDCAYEVVAAAGLSSNMAPANILVADKAVVDGG